MLLKYVYIGNITFIGYEGYLPTETVPDVMPPVDRTQRNTNNIIDIRVISAKNKLKTLLALFFHLYK